MKTLLAAGVVGFVALTNDCVAVDYVTDVLPIMKEHCWKCHSNEHEVKGNVALDDFDEVRDYQIGEFNIIRPGNPDESNFLNRLKLDSGHNDFMPRKADPLPEKEIETIEAWIQAGAVVDRSNPDEDEQTWVAKMGSGGSASATPAFVDWVSADGKVIEARFHSMSGTAVKVVMRDGRSFEIPFSRLDENSIAQAKRMADGLSE